MTHVVASKEINALASEVWRVISDFNNVYMFHLKVLKSHQHYMETGEHIGKNGRPQVSKFPI